MAIDPEKADLERFLAKDTGRPFVLVQLLRFAEGGRDKYLQYAATVQPVTRSIGAQVLYAGECVEPLLAAPGQAWDAIVVVRYPSRAAYAKMHDDPAYGAVVHLRRGPPSAARNTMVPMRGNRGRPRRRAMSHSTSSPKAKIAGARVAPSARDQLPCANRARTRQTPTRAAHARTTAGVLRGREPGRGAEGGVLIAQPEHAMTFPGLQRNGARRAGHP